MSAPTPPIQQQQQMMGGPTIVITTTGQSLSGDQAVRITERGLVTIKSVPEGCEVFDGGASIGVTPTEQMSFEAGNHSIEVRKKGFKTWQRNIKVVPNSTHTFVAELEQE